MLSDCQLAVDQGFDVLKIKIGNNLNQDIERVKAIHAGLLQSALAFRCKPRLECQTNSAGTATT